MKELRLNFTYKCNLGCSYCVSHKSPCLQDKDSLIEEKGAEWYLTQVDNLLKGVDTSDLIIALRGEGDVLQSKAFPAVFQWALQFNGIEFQTNLHGWPTLRNCLVSVSQEKRASIIMNCSYHLGHYLDQNQSHMRALWFKYYTEVANLGITLGQVDIPLTPKCLYDPLFLIELNKIFQLGGHPNPAILVGVYEEKPYPERYTFEELKLVAKYLSLYSPYIWDASEIAHIEHYLHVKGLPCNFRMKRIDIMADGQIQYCPSVPRWNATYKLGEEQDSIPLFESAPIPCPHETCGCKTIGQQFCLDLNQIPIKEYFQDRWKKNE